MPILLESMNIGKIEVKNRFVRSATAEGAADENGMITNKLFEIYRVDVITCVQLSKD